MRSDRVALIVVAVLGATAPARAEEPTPPAPEGEASPPADAPPAEPAVVKDPKVAKKWLQAGNTLLKKGDQQTKQGKTDEAKTSYENAAVAFGKSIEAGDDVTLHLQIAIALEKAGDPIGAMTHLKTLVAAEGVKPDVTAKAQSKLDELSMKVGIVSLTIVPDGTQITLGGKQVAESPMTEPLVLMPGEYVVTLAAVGYQPKDVELKVEAGSESERKIELEPVPIVTKPAEVMPEDKPDVAAVEGPKPNLMPIYIGGGAALGLALIGTVTGIVAIGKHGQYSDSRSETERSDLRSSGKTMALVTDLCLVGALGAAAFTTYWYVTKYRPEAKALAERQAIGPKVDVVPWVQSEAGGLAAVGSF